MEMHATSRSASRRAHLSRQLFSHHFLEVRLREDDLWEEVADEADALRSDLRQLLDRQRDALAGANEDQTEDRWVRPVLESMGWGREVQPRSKRHGTVQWPDYALFLSQEAADEAAAERDHRRVLKRAAGVLEAKRWGRDLDAGDPEHEDVNRVPSTQIINYLVRAQPLSIGERGETIPSERAFRYLYLFFRPRRDPFPCPRRPDLRGGTFSVCWCCVELTTPPRLHGEEGFLWARRGTWHTRSDGTSAGSGGSVSISASGSSVPGKALTPAT